MIILSVDASSTCSGATLIVNDEVRVTAHHNSNKKDDLGKRLVEFGRFLHSVRGKQKLDYVAVLQSHVTRNMKTARMIAYFESVAIAKAGEWNAEVYLIGDKSARKKALGSGKLDKQEVYDILSDKYKLPKFDDGGSDEADSIVAGLACMEANRRS